MWRWVSTKPGITIDFEASITSALGALMLGRTAEILLPSTSTSAASKSPTARSRLSTQPPLIRIGRPGAGAPGACCACAAPITLAAIAGAAAAPAAVVQRNRRRDIADDARGVQQGHEKPASAPAWRRCVMGILPRLVILSGMLRRFRHGCQQDGAGKIAAWVAAHSRKVTE